MPKKKRPELTDAERAKRLKAMARETEADETGEVFRQTFKRVARPRPKTAQKAP